MGGGVGIGLAPVVPYPDDFIADHADRANRHVIPKAGSGTQTERGLGQRQTQEVAVPFGAVLGYTTRGNDRFWGQDELGCAPHMSAGVVIYPHGGMPPQGIEPRSHP